MKLRKLYNMLFVLLFISGFTYAQDTNTVHYSLFIEKSITIGTVDTRIDTGSFKEGEHFIVPEFTLPSSPIDFSIYQSLYNALVGAKFAIDYGALNNDIILKIFIRNLEPAAGKYKTRGSGNDTLFAYFEMRLWELPDSNYYEEDVNFYFNEGHFVRFSIPKSEAFYNFLSLIGIGNEDSLGFAYFENNDWSGAGIETIDKPDSICFSGIHLSKVGGGRDRIKTVTSIELNEIPGIPKSFGLEQNYPNPFNPSTRIVFNIPNHGNVSLKIYDLLGREVRTLVNETMNAGNYEVNFNANELNSGIYFYTLKTEYAISTKKMILMK